MRSESTESAQIKKVTVPDLYEWHRLKQLWSEAIHLGGDAQSRYNRFAGELVKKYYDGVLEPDQIAEFTYKGEE